MTPETSEAPWWREAVIYQVYIRSFADGDGDGIGDLAGLRDRLPCLRDLGVDALWINPWYASPQADAGYDVADYRAIEPAYGTLADAEKLITDAHEYGLRIIPDIVPNHLSDHHVWFVEALAAGRGSAARERFVFREGRGPDGAEPPNNWLSHFGGPAWTRVEDGQWYLHLFAPGQPDVNWEDPDVAAEFEAVLRFWFDRGVDGFRIDVAHGLVKDVDLPDLEDPHDFGGTSVGSGQHPYVDREAVVDVYESWRRIADEYPGSRMFVAEAWTPSPERLSRYVASGRLHTAFNFDYLVAPWDPTALREAIDTTTGYLHAVGAPATWVLENHDVVRAPSRYGRPATDRRGNVTFDESDPVDVELGVRRARAAFLLYSALPGGMYVYQGQELGLPQVDDIPDDALQDPTWERSGHTDRGRDGCRVPIPWTASGSTYGFGPDGGARPWLPQPDWFGAYAVDAETGVDGSFLELARAALATRRRHPALGEGDLSWESAPGDAVLVFRRSPAFCCVVNLSDAPVDLPDHDGVLLASGPLDDRRLPPDTAVWLAAH
ncbi:glycoside hydrolase family 13 protein [Actinomycetospora termitidis]|uniref:Glycoside hydrolase family 13 protein n=1 Tax=Actinomycetospora termitidis TaxID=3053470 RepID=A0ABT7M584_9PSEU|nr:glycoside hydrolase family 13 protein [Actinomycetospora sp. Odt1-22]MDL5154937.1 glycoside hydrolase family 13 protein [Actinomycetospora sp. Odt1-22]